MGDHVGSECAAAASAHPEPVGAGAGPVTGSGPVPPGGAGPGLQDEHPERYENRGAAAVSACFTHTHFPRYLEDSDSSWGGLLRHFFPIGKINITNIGLFGGLKTR